MAKYTVELREIIKSGLKVFNFDYVLYDETQKADFEQKFIDHFFFREIGFETVGRFQHYLKVKCNEVLPYYNELMKLTLLEYDVLKPYTINETLSKTTTNAKTASGNIDQSGTLTNTATTTSEKTSTLDSTTSHDEDTTLTHTDNTTQTDATNKTSTLTVDGKKVESDTPNGLLTMPDIKGNLYASKADIEDTTNTTVDSQTNTSTKTGTTTDRTQASVTDDVDATSVDNTTDTTEASGTTSNLTATTQNENDNGTENYTLNRHGHIGVQTASELLLKHVELLKITETVYKQFFDECDDLFMQLY